MQTTTVSNNLLHQCPELDNLVHQHVSAEMLKYHAGQTMFCPGCDECLDWRSTVSIDVIGATSGKLHWTKALCTKCADSYLIGFAERLKVKAEAKAGEPLLVKTTDGRDWDEDENYSPVPPPKLGRAISFQAARQDQPAGETVSGLRVESLPDWAVFCTYQKSPNLWFVVEHQTGYAVARGSTATDAVANAYRKLHSVGQEPFAKIVASVPAINKPCAP